MKKVLLGIFFGYVISACGQNFESVSASIKTIDIQVSKEAPVEQIKVSDNSQNKIYASLTRIISSMSDEEFNEMKLREDLSLEALFLL